MGRSSSSKPAWKVAGYAAAKLVGYGATSQVWQGHIVRTGEPVALKVLAVTDAAAHRSARAEAALLSALDHPHLLRLHELVSDGNQAILVLDYAAGGSLAQLLERRRRITVGELVTAVAPVAAAVAYLHEEGLVHGDICPANLLFTAQGQPVLADLGVASMCGNTDDPHATLAYLDPAVANGGAGGTPSDVFMLAATALHALTGRPPWVASTAQSLVDLAAIGDIPELDHMLADVPVDVAAVLRRGLSVLPHVRGTAAEFALDLRHAATPAPLELAAGQLRAVDLGLGAGDVDADAHAAVDQQALHSADVAYQPRHGAAPVSTADSSARPQRSARRRSEPSTDLPLERPDFARPDFSRAGARTAPNRLEQASIQGPAGRNDVVDQADVAAAMSLTHQVRARVRSAPPSPVGMPPGLRRWLVGAATISVAAACAGTALVTGWRPPMVGGAAHADAAVTSRAHPPSMSAEPAQAPAAKSSSSTTAAPPAATPAAPTPVATTPAAATPVAPTPASTAESSAAIPAQPTVSSAQPRRTAAGTVDWQTVLSELDAHRERAFATADPTELAQVYIAGSLRTEDAALLRRTLQPGCTATGLRTRYRVLRSRLDGNGAVVVTAAASLAAGVLRCPAAAAQRTAPVTASTLTIQLVDTSAGYRIASLQQSEQR